MPTIAIAQLNFTVGDIAGNTEKIVGSYNKAASENCDLVIFPETSIVGYPPEDLVLRKGFQKAAMQAVEQLAGLTGNGPAILLGGIWNENGHLYNTAFLLDKGRIAHKQYKYKLPNYGVFDEKRVFSAGRLPEAVLWRETKIGILICEDMWDHEAASNLAKNGAEILIVINASPYDREKHMARIDAAQKRVTETGLPLIYVNQVGGQDELVFDGSSFTIFKSEVNNQLQSFKEDFAIIKWQKGGNSCEITGNNCHQFYDHRDISAIYSAMTLGLHDYVEKNRFPGVLLGLSGGIDSALTAAIAVDALGAQRVHAIMMPSPYTAKESLKDAAECAKSLGIKLDIIPISAAMLVFDEMLAPVFAGSKPDITEENIQSRLRGNILMALSNKTGKMVLTTGNKSEMSVGYATLYGDMCGGFNVLKDIYKTDVYKLANWRNRQSMVIDENIIAKVPSAELRPNQADQDSLPPYDLLDAILQRLIEQGLSVSDIVAEGYEKETVEHISRLLYRAEYKRRQAPPGVKISPMSFGRDRRYPVTNFWNS